MTTNILSFDELASTSDEAKKMAKAGAAEGTVVVAEAQTGGRGRLGRAWQSQKGGGLFFSVVLRPEAVPAKCSSFTLAAAVAVKDAINELYELNAKIKWPNDILLNGKKLCGILTEVNIEDGIADFMILGVGVNVNNACFDDKLKDKATSIFLELGVLTDKQKLLDAILSNISDAYEQFKNGGFAGFIEVYENDCVNIGQRVLAHKGSEKISGTAVGITELGELIIQKDGGEAVCVNSGEVSLSQ